MFVFAELLKEKRGIQFRKLSSEVKTEQTFNLKTVAAE
jgi:hypothetical protein